MAARLVSNFDSRFPFERSDSGGLAGLAESLQFLAASTLAGLLIIRLASHLLAEAAAFAQLAEPSDGVLNRLAGTNPELHHNPDPRVKRKTDAFGRGDTSAVSTESPRRAPSRSREDHECTARMERSQAHAAECPDSGPTTEMGCRATPAIEDLAHEVDRPSFRNPLRHSHRRRIPHLHFPPRRHSRLDLHRLRRDRPRGCAPREVGPR